jgi:protein-S-isoprenylcysteine O-methyltransferase Ste14
MGAVLRHLLAIAVFPATMAGVVPALLYRGATWAPRGALVVAGALLVAGGLVLLATTIALFARVGQGTLAPFDPPRRLVVRGVYRHVRNPMISGVIAILLGEALLASSRELLAWAGIFLLFNLIYIHLVEERGLEARFGEDYRLYRRHVRAWIPRLRPWTPPG